MTASTNTIESMSICQSRSSRVTTFSHVGSAALRRQSLTDMPINSSATGPFLCRLPHRQALLLPGQIYADGLAYPPLPTNSYRIGQAQGPRVMDNACGPTFFELYRSSKKLPSIARVAAGDLGF